MWDGSECDRRPRVPSAVIFGGEDGSVPRRCARGEMERRRGGDTEGSDFLAPRPADDSCNRASTSFPRASVYRRAGRSGARRRSSTEIILSLPQCLSNWDRVNRRGSQKSFAVRPACDKSFGSAPYDSSSDTRSTSACCTASISGVTPRLSARLGDALTSRRYSAQCRWWRMDSGEDGGVSVRLYFFFIFFRSSPSVKSRLQRRGGGQKRRREDGGNIEKEKMGPHEASTRRKNQD